MFLFISICSCFHQNTPILGRGNALKAAEFNFYTDPEAAHIVLYSLKCPITVVPLECGLEESINISLVKNHFFFLFMNNITYQFFLGLEI